MPIKEAVEDGQPSRDTQMAHRQRGPLQEDVNLDSGTGTALGAHNTLLVLVMALKGRGLGWYWGLGVPI